MYGEDSNHHELETSSKDYLLVIWVLNLITKFNSLVLIQTFLKQSF